MADYKYLPDRLTCEDITDRPKGPGNPVWPLLCVRFLLVALVLLLVLLAAVSRRWME